MSTLSDEAREARNAYLREWRHKNKDKVKAQKDRYWEKKAREARNEASGHDPESSGDDRPSDTA